MITMTKRYYIGSRDMAKRWDENNELINMGTLADITESAKECVEDGRDEILFVVEVVRVIRRAKSPVVIETIRK